jgi:thiol-disulfide isomerase/thioredoxin
MTETADLDSGGGPARSRWLRRIVELLLFAALFYGVVLWQSRNMLPSDGSERMPSLQLPTLDGGVATVAPDPQRETLMYFFAPWCGVCRATIGHLDAVDPDRTQLVVIALDYPDRAAVAAFVADTGITARVHLGSAETRDLFRVQAYPSYYRLDSEFRVVGRAMGALTAVGLHLL